MDQQPPTEPPSAEQIAAIREDWQSDVPPYMSACDVWIYGRSAVNDLLAALDAVTAERDEARQGIHRGRGKTKDGGPLPTIEELDDPDFTGDLSTEDYMDQMRGRVAIKPLRDQIAKLTADLEAARSALRELVTGAGAGIVTMADSEHPVQFCAYCQAGTYSANVSHSPDCPIVRARVVLGEG